MRKILIIILAAAVISLILLYGKGKDPVDFNKLIDEMVSTANSKDIDGFMNFFSSDYRDSSGINHTLLKKIVSDHFKMFDRFEVAYEEVTLLKEKNAENEDIARVDLELMVSGVKNGVLSDELIGRSGHFRFLTVYFKKSGSGKWKIKEIKGFEDPLY